MIEDDKIYFFRVGKAQYIYGKNSKQEKPYYCMKYKDDWSIDTGRRIFEDTFPRKQFKFDPITGKTEVKIVKDEYLYFESEEQLFKALDQIAAENLNHIMWPLTPKDWIKPYEMQAPIEYDDVFKLKLTHKK